MSSKFWGVLNGDLFHSNAVLRYLSGRMFCSWITMDSNSKIALTHWRSCSYSSTKFNQMKDCVVKVVKCCVDWRTESSIRRIVDQSFDSSVCLEGPPLIPSLSAALVPCSSSFVTKANAVGGPSGKYSSQTNRIPLFAGVCVDYLFSYNKLSHTSILINLLIM